MMALVRGIIGVLFVLSAAGCGDAALKGQGQECFGSSECEPGLTCDLGQSPAVCAPNQTARPDASTTPDIDADLDAPDAMPLPDGDPGAVSLVVTPMGNQNCGTVPAGLLAGQGGTCASYNVSNIGGVTSAALGVALSDTTNFEIVTDTCAGTTLATNADCNIVIEHRSQDVAVTHNATLTLSEASSANITRTMNGIGASALSSAPPSADIGDITVGNSSAGTVFTVTNAANTPPTAALTVTLGGTDPGEFSQVSTCATMTVAAGGTCTVTVTFTPTVAGAKSTTVAVTDGSANKSVSIVVTGNGVAP